jgi:hypothetical protein
MLHLDLFQDSSGLGCNLAKCQIAPMRCSDDQIAEAVSAFPCQTVEFPVKYLGIPWSIKKLPKSALNCFWIGSLTANLFGREDLRTEATD